MDGWEGGWVDDGSMDGRMMGGWMDYNGRMDGWMDG